MLIGGPPVPVFQSRLRSGLEAMRNIRREAFVEQLRETHEVASVRLNSGRNRRMIDHARSSVNGSRSRPLPNRAIAELLGISKAAVTNFRQGKETSKKVQTFFESLFHWCYQPTVHPRLVWHYARQLVIESAILPEPNDLSFATFLKINFLSIQLDRWSLSQAYGNLQDLKRLENQAGANAVSELGCILGNSEHFEASHLQDLVPADDVTNDFLQVGPLCLALDIRLRDIIDEVSR
ncbi:MAG: hypothetical protein AB8G99_08065 [Planctomycetaceae bacterium]